MPPRSRRARRASLPAGVSAVAAAKSAAREIAHITRAAAHDGGEGTAHRVAARVLAEIAALERPRFVSAYLPIGTELDPRPAMLALIELGIGVCVPVTPMRGLPLLFRVWTPQAALIDGTFGVQVPASGAEAVPDVLLVPLLAFDGAGQRLGYGGGYYDRTLAALRRAGPVTALGVAYEAQRVAAVPVEPTDAPLDAVVTEAGVVRRAALAGDPIPA